MSLPVLRASAACVQSCAREKNLLKRSFTAAASVQTTAMSVWDNKKALRKTTSKALKELEDAVMQQQSEDVSLSKEAASPTILYLTDLPLQAPALLTTFFTPTSFSRANARASI